LATARKNGNFREVKRLKQQRRTLPSNAVFDPDYRRLRYVRYADDFLLGFVGPKTEAEEIRKCIGEFLDRIKLTLSLEKTLITHAMDGSAKFLGYEATAIRDGDLIAEDGRRATNGCITLLMPYKVVSKYRNLYSKGGKTIHRAELLADTDYTILQRYQAVLAGIYNFYCMASNVSQRMQAVKWILQTSLLKTLASKYRVRVSKAHARYKVADANPAAYRVVIERPDKEPLIATFGGIRFEKKPEGLGITDFLQDTAWFGPGGNRSEVVQRMLAGKCELCATLKGPFQVHHVRKLADLSQPGRRLKEPWERIMSARKRKTLVVCLDCHHVIHAGRYDGSKL
jgi:hypothetical protein